MLRQALGEYLSYFSSSLKTEYALMTLQANESI